MKHSGGRKARFAGPENPWTALGVWLLLVPLLMGQQEAPKAPVRELHPRVQITTTLGDFTLELDAEQAPLTVINFMEYVQAGFYNGTIFHRVSSPSLIQGGAYTPDMAEKKAGLRAPVASEAYNGLKNAKWTVAMYRAPGQTDSARAQFFINARDNYALDLLRDGAGYTVFGRVAAGQEVIEKVLATPVGTHPKYAAGKNPVVPVTPVVIKSMTSVGPWSRDAALSAAEAIKTGPDRLLISFVKRFEGAEGKEFTVTPSGLRFMERAEGRGAFPLADEAVEFNYTGTLLDGREFDSSQRQADGPITANVNNLRPGLREGMSTMREGGKRVFVVPPELGYGADGVPGRVPPNAVLVYEVELLAVKPAVPRPTIEDIDLGKP